MADFQGPNMSQSWLDEMGAKLDEIIQSEVKSSWNELQSVPSYAERYAVHREHTPFCMNLACECHNDLALLEQQADYIDDGLLTSQEFLRMLSGVQI